MHDQPLLLSYLLRLVSIPPRIFSVLCSASGPREAADRADTHLFRQRVCDVRCKWKGLPATKPPVSKPYCRLKGREAAQACGKIPRRPALLLHKRQLMTDWPLRQRRMQLGPSCQCHALPDHFPVGMGSAAIRDHGGSMAKCTPVLLGPAAAKLLRAPSWVSRQDCSEALQAAMHPARNLMSAGS